jgi:hypothetical protein
MSTPCLTVFATREFDGYEVVETGHFFRKFDGHPETHGQELKRMLNGKHYRVTFELMADVFKGLLGLLSRPEHSSQFCLVEPNDPNIFVEYVYILSLKNSQGEMPRGGSWTGQHLVHLVVKKADGGDPQSGSVLYSGKLDDYVPADGETEVTNTAEEKATRHKPQSETTPKSGKQLGLDGIGER